MSLALPLIVLAIVLVGVLRRVPVYDAFLAGAKQGLATAKGILPFLIGMLGAIGMMTHSGLMALVCGLFAPAAQALRLPAPVVPLMLLRPLSGSAALSMLESILQTYGPDSRTGLVACTLMGSSETVFYTCALYLGAAGVKKSRHAIPAALAAWLAGSVTAALLWPA